MRKLLDIFNWQRFVRVFLNDLMLLQARRVGFASLGLIGIGMIVFLTNASETSAESSEASLVLFGTFLLGGGHIFTSMIFSDMHHPLERFHYLMLPCSNLERFVSRYLITAPLYFIYAVVLYKLFEAFANFTINILFEEGNAMLPLDLGSEEVARITSAWFASHVFMYCAAIWFRSYALFKLMATNVLFFTLCGIVSFLAVRIFYYESFISFFELNPNGPFPNIEFNPFNADGTVKGWIQALILAFLGWVLFLAYLGLDEHEVQDGL